MLQISGVELIHLASELRSIFLLTGDNSSEVCIYILSYVPVRDGTSQDDGIEGQPGRDKQARQSRR